MEKMNVANQVVVRREFYDAITETMWGKGYTTEPIKGGILVNLPDGYCVKVSVSVCDPEKVDGWRQEYAEQMEKNAARAAARAEKEREKAEKARERAEKKAKKEEAPSEVNHGSDSEF